METNIDSEDDFKYPSIFEFPPFFTKQINEQTWKSQLASWDSLILAYCQHYKVWKLSVGSTKNNSLENDLVDGLSGTSLNGSNGSDDVNSKLFANPRINRALKQETIKLIFEYMVEKGHAEWEKSSSKQQIFVYFKRPDEWATDIRRWVDSTGQTGSVLTFYEIAHGDLVASQDFAGIDDTILRKAIDNLVSKNQAVIIKASDNQIMGVKIL
ncbi:ESCRT-II subunit protein VPS25 [Sugiyamaella lignohabitans]|uniref:ESCRT-II subunit protein VPS25 n=1 Tax=Sugiyamaella lignohabitans TaxID=796027 RepID=A0A167DUU7_9ASCO|nr:ESCRT-II subunit protein VPS25 [Sugiyamaella lignohabitans]ANB13316.1 ESCRT-II subunit protein VPS25 [Sugiyamaella lignohabitans]